MRFRNLHKSKKAPLWERRGALHNITSHSFDWLLNNDCALICRNGTSMISLIVPAKGQISKSSKLLTEELGTAACIKSHVNKLSVIDAIKSCKQKLSLYKQGNEVFYV